VTFTTLQTLVIALAVYLAGRVLGERIDVLRRYSIPAPVIGGILFAAFATVLHSFGVTLAFGLELKDTLLLAFFTTLGLAGDLRTLMKGGKALVFFLAAAAGFIAVQNVIGLGLAHALDLHPVVGLLSGSITLTGGHGTGAAYAGRFAGVQNLQGAMELAMACATAGLVLGGVVAGPVAQRLIRVYRLAPTGARAHAADDAATAEGAVTAESLLVALFVVFACLIAGLELARLMEASPVILPSFIWCLLLGLVVRNVTGLFPRLALPAESIETVGSVALSIFLVMALMAMRLWELAALAGPLLLILSVQTVAMIAYAYFVTFRVMGSNYDAAVLSAGHIGFGLSSTACALSVMDAVTRRSGPSPVAFLLVPLVGAFFIDIINAMIIQAFLALPAFGF